MPDQNPIPNDFQTQICTVNGIQMHMAIAGIEGNPLILLLHGFPEFWYSWRFQINALAAAGYRVVAPDQRGYNLTDKTPPYDLVTLTDDINALITTLGYDQAEAIIAHDWGGIVAWAFGGRFPKRVNKIIVCNVPHPMVMSKMFGHLPQLLKSWYIFFFQIPWLPERLFTANDYRAMVISIKRDLGEKLTSEDIEFFKRAWSQPGALSAMIGWYRALIQRSQVWQKLDLTVRVPALMIWGDQDRFLTVKAAEMTRQFVPELQIEYLKGISHWVQQEAPEAVNRLMIDYLKK